MGAIQATKHTNLGVAALVLGILGIVMTFLLPVVLGDPIFALFAIPFAVLAISFGFMAMKVGDSYGRVGLFLGVITIILAVLFVMFFSIAYVVRS